MNNRGFTIIETFVAITILLVAVLGPLSILARAIGDETYLKNQLVSAFLAQEGLELVVNQKDNNMVLLNAPTILPDETITGWLHGLDACKNTEGCGISSVEGNLLVFHPIIPNNNYSNGSICLVGNSYRDCRDSSGVKTPFRRVIKITETNNPPRADITSTVTWTGKGVERKVEIKSTVYEYEKPVF